MKIFIHAETDISEIEPKLKYFGNVEKEKILSLCKAAKQTMRNYLIDGFYHFSSSSTVMCNGKTVTIRSTVKKMSLLKRLFGG